MSKLKQKLMNSIEASKIEIKNEDIQETKRLIKKQLSIATFEKLQFAKITVYHIESLYRDNTNDKYEFRK